MNSVNLIGRLTADPAHHERPGTTGRAACGSPCSAPARTARTAAPTTSTSPSFGRQAEICAQYLAKGRKIAVTRPAARTASGTARTAAARSSRSIAETVDFLDRAAGDDDRAGASSRPPRRAGAARRDARAGASRQTAALNGERHATPHIYHHHKRTRPATGTGDRRPARRALRQRQRHRAAAQRRPHPAAGRQRATAGRDCAPTRSHRRSTGRSTARSSTTSESGRNAASSPPTSAS